MSGIPHTVSDQLHLSSLLPMAANNLVSNSVIVTVSNMLGVPGKLMSPSDPMIVSALKESVLVTGYNIVGSFMREMIPAFKIFTQ